MPMNGLLRMGKDTFSGLSSDFSPHASFPSCIDTQAKKKKAASSAQGFLRVVIYTGISGCLSVTIFVLFWSLLSLIFPRLKCFLHNRGLYRPHIGLLLELRKRKKTSSIIKRESLSTSRIVPSREVATANSSCERCVRALPSPTEERSRALNAQVRSLQHQCCSREMMGSRA